MEPADQEGGDAAPGSSIAFAPLGEGDADSWRAFLHSSNNGVLHHDLDFLAYHPAGRYHFDHAIARREGAIVALLPGGLVEDRGHVEYRSPLGASVGGLVTSTVTLADHLAIVESLQGYVRQRGWDAIELVLGPTAYQRRPGDALSFALLANGFRLVDRQLCFVAPLLLDGLTPLTNFRKKQAWGVRSAARRGVRVAHGGIALMPDFLTLFHGTYRRHGVPATHSEDELVDLFNRLPEAVLISVATIGALPLAALLTFRLSVNVAQTMYICGNREHARENGTVAAIASLMDLLVEQGCHYLDFGPSASTRAINDGVVFFKEGLGGIGQARDRWRWDVVSPVSSHASP